MLSGNKTGVTYTIRTLHTKLKDTGINLPLGKILSLCPFFITYATDKEISLCMCKVCLNKRPLHNVLLVQDKTDEDDSNKSITHFFMQRCDCPKSCNVYYRWKCVSNKCKDWKKDWKTIWITKTPCKKTNKIGEVIEKVSLKTEKRCQTKIIQRKLQFTGFFKKILFHKVQA